MNSVAVLRPKRTSPYFFSDPKYFQILIMLRNKRFGFALTLVAASSGSIVGVLAYFNKIPISDAYAIFMLCVVIGLAGRAWQHLSGLRSKEEANSKESGSIDP